jgi:hypothetical protein
VSCCGGRLVVLAAGKTLCRWGRYTVGWQPVLGDRTCALDASSEQRKFCALCGAERNKCSGDCLRHLERRRDTAAGTRLQRVLSCFIRLVHQPAVGADW